jgi:hypothetical protein
MCAQRFSGFLSRHFCWCKNFVSVGCLSMRVPSSLVGQEGDRLRQRRAYCEATPKTRDLKPSGYFGKVLLVNFSAKSFDKHSWDPGLTAGVSRFHLHGCTAYAATRKEAT